MIIIDSDILVLNNYLQIFLDFPYGERAPEFTGKDEKVIEDIYNRWRGTEEIVINCDECLEEAFNRLMIQLSEQHGQNRVP